MPVESQSSAQGDRAERERRQGIGRFAYDVATRSWTWSPGIYGIHGFAVGEVVPSTELVRAHVHPDDRAAVAELQRRTLADGEPFRAYYRIVDAQQQVRRVIAVGGPVRSPAGHVARLHGHLVDVTSQCLQAAAEAFLERNAVVEQAKGVLMQVACVDATGAEALLTQVASRTGAGVRDVADCLVAATVEGRLPHGCSEGAVADQLVLLVIGPAPCPVVPTQYGGEGAARRGDALLRRPGSAN